MIRLFGSPDATKSLESGTRADGSRRTPAPGLVRRPGARPPAALSALPRAAALRPASRAAAPPHSRQSGSGQQRRGRSQPPAATWSRSCPTPSWSRSC